MNLMTKIELVDATAAIGMMRNTTVIGGGTITALTTMFAENHATAIGSVSAKAIDLGRLRLEGDNGLKLNAGLIGIVLIRSGSRDEEESEQNSEERGRTDERDQHRHKNEHHHHRSGHGDGYHHMSENEHEDEHRTKHDRHRKSEQHRGSSEGERPGLEKRERRFTDRFNRILSWL